jgi:hypothetical protein
MRIVAEEIDDEIYIDALLLEEEILAVLNNEFVQGEGNIGRKQINLGIARGEAYRNAAKERKE